MTALELLTEKRERVISFYNTEIKGNWNISLKAFMTDLLNNFEKYTKASIEGYTNTDLTGNLFAAKTRLGEFDNKVEVAFDRDAYRKSKAPNGQWIAII